MTLETVYYITQIIAVGAILASLVAIYIQQRKDHVLARAENQRAILEQVESFMSIPLASPDSLENIRTCYVDFEGATPAQQASFAHLIHKSISIAEAALYMRNDKLIAEASYKGFEGAALLSLVTPGGRQYWQRVRMAIGADIRSVFDRALSEPTDIPPVWEVFPQFAPDEIQAAISDEEDALSD